jgi:hypothetical protein
MKPNNLDQMLYDAGAITTLNSVLDPLVAFRDADALEALAGYLRVLVAQSGSLGLAVNEQAAQAFILHAQRVQKLDGTFLGASFDRSVLSEVPQNPPVAPDSLAVADAGGGVVNASSGVGSGYVDRYELHRRIDGIWERVVDGVIRQDGTGVDYQETGVSAGTWEYRVVPVRGFFRGFPGSTTSVDVAG